MKNGQIKRFNDICDVLNKHDKTSFGMMLINTSYCIGEFGKEVYEHRKDKKYTDGQKIVERLIDVQIMISSLYSELKIRNGTIIDKRTYPALVQSFNGLSRSYSFEDAIWVYYKIVSFFGEIMGTFNMRTNKEDDVVRSKTLMILQSYVMIYIDQLRKKYPEINGIEYDDYINEYFDMQMKDWKADIENESKKSLEEIPKYELPENIPEAPKMKPKVIVSGVPPLPPAEIMDAIKEKLVPKKNISNVLPNVSIDEVPDDLGL